MSKRGYLLWSDILCAVAAVSFVVSGFLVHKSVGFLMLGAGALFYGFCFFQEAKKK